MRDVRLTDIVTEIENEFPVKIPRFIIWKIVNYALKVLFKEIGKPRRQFNFIRSDIVKIYEVDTGKEELGAAMDLDETRIPKPSEYAPVRRMDYYEIRTDYIKGGPSQKIIQYRGNRKRKANQA